MGRSRRDALAGRGGSEHKIRGGAFDGIVERDGVGWGSFEKAGAVVNGIKARMPKLDAAGVLRFRVY